MMYKNYRTIHKTKMLENLQIREESILSILKEVILSYHYQAKYTSCNKCLYPITITSLLSRPWSFYLVAPSYLDNWASVVFGDNLRLLSPSVILQSLFRHISHSNQRDHVLNLSKWPFYCKQRSCLKTSVHHGKYSLQ